MIPELKNKHMQTLIKLEPFYQQVIKFTPELTYLKRCRILKFLENYGLIEIEKHRKTYARLTELGEKFKMFYLSVHKNVYTSKKLSISQNRNI